MYRVYKIFIFSILLSAMFACDKEIVAPDNQKAIVNGYLLPGQNAVVTITSEIPYGENVTTSLNIDGLTVQITTSDSIWHTMQNIGNGMYMLDSTILPILANKGYRIQFAYHGYEVSASTFVPAKPTGFITSQNSLKLPAATTGNGGFNLADQPAPITLSWNGIANNYYYVVIESAEQNPQLISTTSNRPRFRSQPIQGSSLQIQSRSFTYYGKQNVILFSVSPDYAALYINAGSNNSQNFTTPPSNVQNGFGIFTGINTDTLQIDVE